MPVQTSWWIFPGSFAYVEGDEADENAHLQYRLNVEHRCTYILLFSYFLFGEHICRLAVKAAPPLDPELDFEEFSSYNFTTLFMADKAGSRSSAYFFVRYLFFVVVGIIVFVLF